MSLFLLVWLQSCCADIRCFSACLWPVIGDELYVEGVHMLLTLLAPTHAIAGSLVAFQPLRTLSRLNVKPALSSCLLLTTWGHWFSGHLCWVGFWQDVSALASFQSVLWNLEVAYLPSQLVWVKVATFFLHQPLLSTPFYHWGRQISNLTTYVDIQPGKEILSPFVISICHLHLRFS